MILLKLRASFGKLHEELVLHEGMNLLCLPNEAGKSTWSAFVLSMLYGIDTAERASAANQGLPAKERYKPWDGTPMSGSIDLLWEGRAVTIERTSGRVPLGNFRAYETRSGTPIPELTAEKLCRHLHVSSSYFSALFKRETGRNFPNYLTETRMRQAMTLLAGTDMKTASIAEAVGVPDPSYFSYVFKRVYGLSPSQVRRRREGGA